ncbi:flagellar biosynthesis protein FlhF [Dyella sp. 2RAB6]|uniref:flagellar biosynthesis protein FlhF n=1 Tax=Dyella sp. 2RAB6 TaxID=3232992 RepID=UPI003F90E411
MKIKRFVAADMRQAMREVREEQGPDAVILSTRRLDEGVEIIAAVDYDESLVREAARSGEPLPTEVHIVRERAPEAPALPPKPRRAPVAAPVAASVARAPAVAAPIVAAAPVAAPVATPADPAPLHPMVEQAALDTARMRAELGSLRELLESQMASLAWNDLQRRHPLRGRVLRDMTRIGIEPDVARRLADELPDRLSADQARYLPLGVLSRSLAITGYDLAASGGVVALVGPTGVGKTTTIAKLAARAVLRHGASQVALVSTDNYRIGAAAQLEHYGRLLGTRVFPAHDAESLREVLDVLRGRRVVLVDTAGVAGSDPRLEQQMQLLRAAGELRTCLVLAANAQAQAIDDMLRAFLPQQPQACILTKLDEAPSLGGALSALIRHRLPLDYTTDGQRVPEDLATADARVLVCRAAQVLKGNAPAVDEGYMAERFGMAMAGAR